MDNHMYLDNHMYQSFELISIWKLFSYHFVVLGARNQYNNHNVNRYGEYFFASVNRTNQRLRKTFSGGNATVWYISCVYFDICIHMYSNVDDFSGFFLSTK